MFPRTARATSFISSYRPQCFSFFFAFSLDRSSAKRLTPLFHSLATEVKTSPSSTHLIDIIQKIAMFFYAYPMEFNSKCNDMLRGAEPQ